MLEGDGRVERTFSLAHVECGVEVSEPCARQSGGLMMAAGGGLARCSGQAGAGRGAASSLVGSHRFGGTVWMEPHCPFDEFWDCAGCWRVKLRDEFFKDTHAAPVAPSARHASSALRRLSREGRLRPMKVTHERRGSAWMVKGGELASATRATTCGAAAALSLSPAPRRRGLSSRAQPDRLKTDTE